MGNQPKKTIGEITEKHTYFHETFYRTRWMKSETFARERKNILFVGRDPVAVETVGSGIVGEEP